MIKDILKQIIAFIRRTLGLKTVDDRFARIQLLLMFLLYLGFLGAFVLALVEGQWTVLFVSAIAMVAVWLPLLLAKNRNINIPVGFQFLLVLFVYSTLILGEIRGFYTKFWWWDVVSHAGSSIALGFIGFLILYSLYYSGPLKANPALLSVFAFSFALSLGALWEIFEFAMDNLFGLDMQKSGLVDTMWDLIVDAVGAFITAVSGYFYVKHRKRGIGIFQYYLQEYLRNN